MPAISLLMGVLGAASHALALYAYYTFSPPARIIAPEATKYLGAVTWLTFQTNLLCMMYFAAAVCLHAFESALLSSFVEQCFPLIFSLGFALSFMYYGLQHFNPENVQKRNKLYPAMGYHHVALACHLEHGMSTPIAVLNACTIALPATSSVNTVLLPYLCWYFSMLFLNLAATRTWPYPIVDDAQRAGGWPGVLVFFAIISALFFGFGHLGNWVAALQLG